MDEVVEGLETWSILLDLGFQPDPTVISDISPGLRLRFGDYRLTASAHMNRWFARVITIRGIHSTPRTMGEIDIELPRTMESVEQCFAWIAWGLDRSLTFAERNQPSVAWHETGRAHQRLLPWVVAQEALAAENAAYAARPCCHVDREWAKVAIKKLKATLTNDVFQEDVIFAFDGEILRIRTGEVTLSVAASGAPWTGRYLLQGLKATQLPSRLMNDSVTFSAWKGSFAIDSYRYENVVTEADAIDADTQPMDPVLKEFN